MNEADFAVLASSGIPTELAIAAGLRRVDSREGAELVGRNGGGDYSGIAFPYVWPGDSNPREFRLRRDRPDLEQTAEGPKERAKYVAPPGRGNLLYFAPNTQPEWLSDIHVPIVIAEGEKKTLALSVLSWHDVSEGTEKPRFLPVGLSGVWNWRGTVGKEPGPDGERRDVKGVISDFDKIAWGGRVASIVFDTNVLTNDSVSLARKKLADELQRRGANVQIFHWPTDTGSHINGIDDLVGAEGPDYALRILQEQSRPFNRTATEAEPFVVPAHWKTLDLADLESWPCEPLRPIVDGILARGNLVSIAAPSQTAKTLFTIWLMRKILKHGRLFERYEITAVDRIAYLVLEDPARRIKARMQDTAHEFDPIEKGRLTFHIAPSFSLIDPQMCDWLESIIASGAGALDVLVIDTYQKATPGLSSFNDEQQSVILHRLANLTRKLGVAIIVLDHIRKADKSGRGKRVELSIDDVKGSGGKVQNADCVILMERTPDKKQVKFQCFSKDFDSPVRIVLDVAPKGSKGPKFTYATDLEALGSTSHEKTERRRKALVESMEPGEWVSIAEIAKAVNVDEKGQKTLQRDLNAMIGRELDASGEKKLRRYCRNAEGIGQNS